MIRTPTPGQTVGPFFGYALPFEADSQLVPVGHPDAIRLHGTVFDGHGDPVSDALLEVWQLDPDGAAVRQQGSLHRDGYTFTGWGRASTDATGHYAFTTLWPGAEPGKAAFFAITVFARGLLDRLLTRAYIPGDEAALAADPLLSSLPADRRSGLVATPDLEGFRFDVHLQGDRETVFLRYPGDG
ncbi:protocatechuate 3,4-dioxygenase subunit alpha [Leekyejoonella antrihumi]|uniref:Protocatechuate 3,4-dioxygenase subunit alpha n=1 Tax=Leekyejoonella antrihumi TaxID=1660198 RepID=A0A563E236_9MICO|nr:protocatechuate 3,4-dioxygenase subunit alpha [Leekyejoonella antrihumi]TWP36610.1 protocatechuate 3,4-dioxygenase subunit alpha [Leekyejoonella antrihumi]